MFRVGLDSLRRLSHGRGVQLMYVYFAPGKRFAFYVEVARELGCFPLFSLNFCKDESIIDIPYIQIIVTPGRLLRDKTGTENETGTGGSDPPSGRVAENRP